MAISSINVLRVDIPMLAVPIDVWEKTTDVPEDAYCIMILDTQDLTFTVDIGTQLTLLRVGDLYSIDCDSGECELVSTDVPMYTISHIPGIYIISEQ